jgi:hypothetical protein
MDATVPSPLGFGGDGQRQSLGNVISNPSPKLRASSEKNLSVYASP